MDELEERLDTVYETRTQRELERLDRRRRRAASDAQRRRTARMPVRRGEDGSSWLVSIMSGHERKGRWRVGREPQGDQHHGRLGPRPQRRRARRRRRRRSPSSRSWAAPRSACPRASTSSVSDFAFMGGNDSDVGDERPDPGGPTLRIKLISIMGGIRHQARPQAHARRAQGAAKHLRARDAETAGRSSARGTSSAVIGPIARRSVVPGGRSPRAVRGSRGGAGRPNSRCA